MNISGKKLQDQETTGILSHSQNANSPSAFMRSDTNAPSRMRGFRRQAGAVPHDNELFNNRADLKLQISQIAMHLTKAQRNDLFQQLDELLDSDEWMDGDSLILKSSFLTFLRFLIHSGPVKRPSLTVSGSGNIASSWIDKEQRLTVEFWPDDVVRLTLYRKLGDGEHQSETNAYQGPLLRMENVLAAFGAQEWYRDGAA